MRNKFLTRCIVICIAALMVFTPVNVSAATLLKKGSKGSEVVMVQKALKNLGYYTYSKTTGYYGSITVDAVKHFQRDNGIAADGVIGKKTMSVLNELEKKKTEAQVKVQTIAQADGEAVIQTMAQADGQTVIQPVYAGYTKAVSGAAFMAVINSSSEYNGALDWFKEVRYIWDKGEDAVVTDVETGLSFKVKRTYGTNHADVEPLTKEDAAVIKEIWGGFSWKRRAVVVQLGDYTIAASMTAMPHAGLDSKPADRYISGRSEGYGWGKNLDKVKNNGCNGVMDIHFKNSRTHTTNIMQKSQQDMVKRAAVYIASLS